MVRTLSSRLVGLRLPVYGMALSYSSDLCHASQRRSVRARLRPWHFVEESSENGRHLGTSGRHTLGAGKDQQQHRLKHKMARLIMVFQKARCLRQVTPGKWTLTRAPASMRRSPAPLAGVVDVCEDAVVRNDRPVGAVRSHVERVLAGRSAGRGYEFLRARA